MFWKTLLSKMPQTNHSLKKIDAFWWVSWFLRKVSYPNITTITNSTNFWICMPTSTYVTHSHQSLTSITTLTLPSSDKTLKESSLALNTKFTPELWNRWKSQPEINRKDWFNTPLNLLISVEEKKYQSFTRLTSWNSLTDSSWKSQEESQRNILSSSIKKWLLIIAPCS